MYIVNGEDQLDINFTPFAQITITPAFKWVKDSLGFWQVSDRGAAQDIYRSKIIIRDTDDIINALQTFISVSGIRQNITTYLTNAYDNEIFGPEISSGIETPINITIENYGVRKHPNNYQSELELSIRLLQSFSVRNTTASLSEIRFRDSWEGDSVFKLNRNFSFDQSYSYSSNEVQTGSVNVELYQTTAQTRAILSYLLNSYRAQTFSLNFGTFGIQRPFGGQRGDATTYNVKCRSITLQQKDLDYWIIGLNLVEAEPS